MRIFLTGFMGAGKTTVGRHLAARLGLGFVDLDRRIEAAAGLTVREIFERIGEAEFRRLEHEALREVCQGPGAVIATGGGTIAQERNLELIRRSGISFWLHPPFAVIVQRIGGRGKRDRPLFADEIQAWELYRERLAAYRQADLTVRVEPQEAADEVAGRIVLMLRSEPPCAT